MSDIHIQWKKITRGRPKIRRHADDRAPTIEEIQQLCNYPDRRIKGIVYTMATSGRRLGAWNYLRWKSPLLLVALSLVTQILVQTILRMREKILS
jgi:hypothetical protein